MALTAAGSGISSYVLLNHINKKNCSLKRSAEFTGTNPSHHSCRHRAACALSTAPPSKPLRRGLLLQFFFLIQSPQRLSAMAHADPFRPWWRGAGSVPLAVPAPGHAPGHTAQPRRCSGVKRAGGWARSTRRPVGRSLKPSLSADQIQTLPDPRVVTKGKAAPRHMGLTSLHLPGNGAC